MGKNKLKRWKEIREFENVFEYTDYWDKEFKKPKGEWAKIFGNPNPIVAELACGKGEYTLNLARKNPDKNFIGMDIKGARIWVGAKQALEENLYNVRFIRMFIDHLEEFFCREEISEIWITFPDPYLKDKKVNKRLTSPVFLKRYGKVLKQNGFIHLKTDSSELFRYTLETLESEGCRISKKVKDIYREGPEDPFLGIKTYYEKSHLKVGKSIKYVKFQLPQIQSRLSRE